MSVSPINPALFSWTREGTNERKDNSAGGREGVKKTKSGQCFSTGLIKNMNGLNSD
jgi:hypothetical protein